MKTTSRRVWTGLALASGFAALALVGCSGTGGQDGDTKAVGQMSLPLTTQGASGATYRLRNATFVVQSQYYGYDPGWAGAGNSPGYPGSITVSSETDPNARNISLSLEEGAYYVQLLPGWSMEKSDGSATQTVEATLLSGISQWVYVSRQSTSWAEYSFGIGGRELWLNGKLNIGIDVQETPPGEGGAAGAAGPAAGAAGSPEQSVGGSGGAP